MNSDAYDGECIVTERYDHEHGRHTLTIDRADPRIRIDADYFDELRANHDRLAPGVEVDFALLKIRAINRTVIYRIVDYDPQRNTYLAEWPD